MFCSRCHSDHIWAVMLRDGSLGTLGGRSQPLLHDNGNVLCVDSGLWILSISMMYKLSASAAATPALFYSSSQISSQHHLIAKVWLSHLRCYQSESELVTRFRSNWLENTGQATPDTRQATYIANLHRAAGAPSRSRPTCLRTMQCEALQSLQKMCN